MNNKIILFFLFPLLFFSSFSYAEEREKSLPFNIYIMGAKYFDIPDRASYSHNYINEKEKISPLIGFALNFGQIEKFCGFSLKIDYSPLISEDYSAGSTKVEIYSFLLNIETRITYGGYLSLGAGFSIFDYSKKRAFQGVSNYLNEEVQLYPVVCSLYFRQMLNKKISFLFEFRYYFNVDEEVYNDFFYDEIYLGNIKSMGFSLMTGLAFYF